MALAPAPLPVRAPPRASRPPTSTDRSTAAGKVGSVASCRSPAGATAATATAILPTAPLLMRTSSTRTATATARTMTARTAGGCAITILEAIQARSTAAAGGARQCTASSTAVTTASPSARPRLRLAATQTKSTTSTSTPRATPTLSSPTPSPTAACAGRCAVLLPSEVQGPHEVDLRSTRATRRGGCPGERAREGQGVARRANPSDMPTCSLSGVPTVLRLCGSTALDVAPVSARLRARMLTPAYVRTYVDYVDVFSLA
ncbi:hypothetical protein EMIHUDRAFT_435091, partial [Emiliania huxleyi CCMP1516]|uniref:Uncharacterized protein n=2 Tax=Emiliania huxleyi TaxID=2903 RepID=A0A0D3JSN3_EMIH1